MAVRHQPLLVGRYSGRYVSGLPAAAQLKLAQRLVRAERVPVHLMYRHRSGNYESSSLRLFNGPLTIVVSDREELA